MTKTAEAPLPLRIYLIRHAESVGNVGQIVTGQSDLPLSDLGREQARYAGLALANRPIEVIYVSPLARVWDTALPISQTTGAPIVALDDLREMNCGLAEGLTWAEVEERWPDFARRYTSEDNAIAVAWPGGESGLDLRDRIGRAIRQILDEHLGTTPEIALVGHAGSIAWSLQHLLKKPLDIRPHFGLKNCSISELLVHHPAEPAEVIRFNDVSHLEERTKG